MAETKMRAIMSKEVRKIVKESRDPDMSLSRKFIIRGELYKFQEAQQLSDEELANAVVINSQGYYVRKGLEDVSSAHEYRRSSAQDRVKDEYKVTITYEEVSADTPEPKEQRGFMDWLRYFHEKKEIKKSQANAKKIISEARDSRISSSYTFIIDGKSYNFDEAQIFSDIELANACVIDSKGYYIRKALQDVSLAHQLRRSAAQDFVKEEYKYKEEK